jgi:hypothetical protein
LFVLGFVVYLLGAHILDTGPLAIY